MKSNFKNFTVNETIKIVNARSDEMCFFICICCVVLPVIVVLFLYFVFLCCATICGLRIYNNNFTSGATHLCPVSWDYIELRR